MSILDILVSPSRYWARSERLRNLYDIYFASRSRREIRLTAVGWRPDESWIEDHGEAASRNREFYKVIRKGRP